MAVPKLRFKADNGSEFPEWEEKRLGDVGAVAMCKRVFKEQTSDTGEVPFFKIGTFGGKPDAYISYALFKELKEKYPYPKKGTVLLSASGTVGRQVMYNGENAYYQDSNIVWLEHDDTVIDGFLNQFYSIVKWKGLEGSTIKRLYNKTILDTVFYRPSLPEQRKIASFLSTIDDIIQSTESELTAWQERKKGVMQKIFNREVRFKADDGSEFPEWEEKRLGELGEFIGGGTPSTKVKEYWKGTIPWISSSDVFENDIQQLSVSRFITEEAIEKSATKRIPENSICIVCRVGVGKVVIAPFELCTSQDFVSITALKDDICFLGYAMWNLMQRKISDVRGTSIKGIPVKDLREYMIDVPSLPEQRKIAECLSSLDDVINQIDAELSAWKEFKKGLLQQMFV